MLLLCYIGLVEHLFVFLPKCSGKFCGALLPRPEHAPLMCTCTVHRCRVMLILWEHLLGISEKNQEKLS
jgi:hypothetical protein